MKKLMLSFVIIALAATATGSYAAAGKGVEKLDPQEKIVKDFNMQFALDPAIIFADNGYIASSVMDGHEVSAAYTKKGNRVYSIVRYTSDNLDKHIVEIVKSKYDKYFITSMEKVDQPNVNPVFIVHLTNDNSIKTVRISDGSIELLQNFKKV